MLMPVKCFTIKYLLLFALAFLCDVYVGNCQEIQARYLGIEDGLSNNAVNAIFQDHDGFMWFGTYDGLNRYDGYGFRTYRNIIGDTSSIRSNNINCITEDAHHNIWVGGQKDISILNQLTNRFSSPSYVFSNGTQASALKDNATTILPFSENIILAGTQHNGLFVFDNNVFKGKQVPLIKNGKPEVNYYVVDIKHNKATNKTYVFIQNEGLFTYDLEKKKFTLINNTIGIANCITISKSGKLWLGNNTGLYYLNDTTNTFSTSVMSSTNQVVNICEDKKGVLWIATDGGGVWLFSRDKSKAYPLSEINESKKPLISSNAVYAIYEDKEERKWIGTLRGGINILESRPNAFRKVVYHSGKENNVIENFIFSFCEDDNKNIWIGTDGSGLRYWDKLTDTYQTFKRENGNSNAISSNFITSIVKDANNNIWIGTWSGGINRYDKNTHAFKHYTCFNPATNNTNNNVWMLLPDSHKRLWASTVRNGALYLYNTGKNSFEVFDDNLTELQSLAEDAEGNIWGGDYSSLIKIDTLHKKHVFYNIGFAVRCIYQDKKNNFWVGTQEGGLLLFNRKTGSFRRFTTAEGLPHNTVLRILEDNNGCLWMSTYNGISKFDPATNTFKNFSQADGLQSNQFSFNGALKLSSGDMLFGGIKGFNIFDPDSISLNKKVPKLFLTGIKIDNNAVEYTPSYIKERALEKIKKIEIPYNKASLSLDFLGLDYSDAAGINYAYNLYGWDKNWNFVNHTRSANYSRLYEGNYVFKVKSSNSDGSWGSEQDLLYITVLPPWYRTWWAYALYILCAIAVIYVYTYYKQRQAKLQYEVQLAHLETQKEKELNEKKIAFFTNVSHEFRTPLSLIINPIKDLLKKNSNGHENDGLKVVYRNAQRLLRLVDQLLLFKKADAETDKLHFVNIQFNNLCHEVYSCFTEQARSKKINYVFKCDNSLQHLLIRADREKLEISIFNILSNAFKYTPENGEVIFHAEDAGAQIKINISDSGAGIPEKEGGKLFERFYQAKEHDSKVGFGIGLYLVKNFVEAHNGKVSYSSKVGHGTTFTIWLNKEHIVARNETPINKPDIQPVASLVDGETTVEKSITEKHAEAENGVMPEVSEILQELNEPVIEEEAEQFSPGISEKITTDKQTLLVIDDDDEIRNYLVSLFSDQYKIYQANNAKDGISLARKQLPDLIISDVVMKGLNGLDLCNTLKQDNTVSHIPIILLTGSSSDEMQLKGMESGADDYIKKPFDKDILVARVNAILKRRNVLQNYFYNEVTLGNNTFKVSEEYREFLERCMKIIEEHLDHDDFSIKMLAGEIGMSHSNLYKKIKAVSGQSVNGFIRFIRLKKAAEILINTENNVNETAIMVGFNDIKYFRAHFVKLFGITPSEYIRKFRKSFQQKQTLDDKVRK